MAERKVVGYRNPDGSANLTGYNLPVDRVAAACGHIDALAKAAKQAGDARPIDHIRADLFLGMTDGSYAGLDDQTILERLRASCESHKDVAQREDTPGHNDPDGRSRPGDKGPDGNGPDGNGPGESGVAAKGGADGTAAPAARPSRVGAGMELRARLSTLLGRTSSPGN